MPINRLYNTLRLQMQQLHPHERVTRVRNLIWLMVGIWHSQSVHLSRVATHIPGSAVVPSVARRLSRFLDNPTWNVRDWYAPLAQQWLDDLGRTAGQVRLVIDGTKVGRHHQLLMVSLTWRHRAIPVAWTWVAGAKGHSGALRQQALLAHVRRLLPGGVPVLLVGDTEFETVDLMRQLEQWGWRYALRQRASALVETSTGWQALGSLLARDGQSLWLEAVRLTARHAHETNVLAYWKVGQEKPWLLATNLPSARLTFQAYRYRMWIEEMFGDLKDHGFDLEASRLTSFVRLSRLTMAVVLVYVWMMMGGHQAIKNSGRFQVDRSDRRDLSVFQIGLRLSQRLFTNARHVPVAFTLPISTKLSGS